MKQFSLVQLVKLKSRRKLPALQRKLPIPLMRRHHSLVDDPLARTCWCSVCFRIQLVLIHHLPHLLVCALHVGSLVIIFADVLVTYRACNMANHHIPYPHHFLSYLPICLRYLILVRSVELLEESLVSAHPIVIAHSSYVKSTCRAHIDCLHLYSSRKGN